MARTVYYDKETILNKACDFVKEFGVGALNARDLCKYIGCSTQPLFRNFINMDDLKKQVKNSLHDFYDKFIYKIVEKDNYLYSISYAYALFALKESYTFKVLFMSELAGNRTIDEVLNSSWNLETIESIPQQYNITYDAAKMLYRDVRFFTHGLACQIACKSIIVEEKEIEELISNLIKKILR